MIVLAEPGIHPALQLSRSISRTGFCSGDVVQVEVQEAGDSSFILYRQLNELLLQIKRDSSSVGIHGQKAVSNT